MIFTISKEQVQEQTHKYLPDSYSPFINYFTPLPVKIDRGQRVTSGNGAKISGIAFVDKKTREGLLKPIALIAVNCEVEFEGQVLPVIKNGSHKK